jgi:site-specific recombinase XerD
MAYVIQRGQRFTGYYRDRHSRRHSAGTFSTREEAFKQAESVEKSGIIGGLQTHLTLQAYVYKWLPKADLLPLTKKTYGSVLQLHVLPILGRKKVNQINRVHVREMLEELRQRGVGASTREQAKSALGSALKALVEADQLDNNPTHKIKVKKLDSNELRNILEPSEFKEIVSHLQSPTARLFATFLALSGCRYGEATELRVKDLNVKSNEVYVQRRVNDLGSYHNNGERFRVVDATKSGHRRAVVVAPTLAKALQKHVQDKSLQKNDLLFSKDLIAVEKPVRVSVRNKHGNLTHGTVYSYTHGKCRCEECRTALRDYRRVQRRMQDKSEKKLYNSSGHLPRDTWRRIWQKAIEASSLDWSPRTHDLRHANATLLLKNGIDIHEVKERLGHSSIRTTERYLHRVKSQASHAANAVSEFL